MRDGDAFRVILMKPVNNVPIVDDGAEPPKGAVLLGYLVEVRICLSHSTCGNYGRQLPIDAGLPVAMCHSHRVSSRFGVS